MAGFEQIILIGNLGADPEMRYTPNTVKAVTTFSLAVNRVYTNAAGEKVKETKWFRVTAWDKLAEVCNQYLQKGSQVMVIGRLHADPKTGGPRLWTDKAGNTRASFEITASTVHFLSKTNGQSDHAPADFPPAAGEEEIPF